MADDDELARRVAWNDFGRPKRGHSSGARIRRYERLQRLLIAQDFLCALCGKPFDYTRRYSPTIDHRRPRARGGTNDEANLQVAHQICNELKGDTWDDPTDQ